jgi:hypothetical protein
MLVRGSDEACAFLLSFVMHMHMQLGEVGGFGVDGEVEWVRFSGV